MPNINIRDVFSNPLCLDTIHSLHGLDHFYFSEEEDKFICTLIIRVLLIFLAFTFLFVLISLD